jgi:ferredoxin/flavodoxin
MDKQLSLVYFSATGCTAKIAKEVARGIGGVAKEYDITLPADRQKEPVFNSNDLVIIAAPVYAGRVPRFLGDYFAKIKGNNAKAVFVVVYGNREYDDALLELKDTLENNGFIGIAGGAFIGEHSYTSKVAGGRPDINDLSIAMNFGIRIKEKLSNEKSNFQTTELLIKGKFPYKERRAMPLMTPETNWSCINCRLCAKHCPMNAIDFCNVKEVDAAKCIKCCSCIKKCPVGAKSINHDIFNKFTQGLIANCSAVIKEVEIFI